MARRNECIGYAHFLRQLFKNQWQVHCSYYKQYHDTLGMLGLFCVITEMFPCNDLYIFQSMESRDIQCKHRDI